jgi:phage shock protein E
MRKTTSWIFAALAAVGVLFLLGAGDGGAFLTGKQAKALVKQGAMLLDVREPDEFAAGHIDGAVNIPVGQLGARLKELEGKQDKDIVVYCHTGHRSSMAQDLLKAKGFKKVHNLGPRDNWNTGG